MANATANKDPKPMERASKFLRECWVELRKTSWPSYDELKKSTFLVIAAVAIVTLWIGGLDFVLGAITRHW
jgi:preprotein translocase SecE subunit